MAKFTDIEITAAIILVLLFLAAFTYTLLNEEHYKELPGHVVFKDEPYEKKRQHPPRFLHVCKIIFTGFLRGFFMGYFVGGFEAACVGGIGLALVNPTMTIAEHYFYNF
jgi:hypothetical protein